jgi:hypothetical protein
MARFAEVGVSGGIVDLLAREPLEVGMKLRDAEDEVPLDVGQGASFQNRPREIAGQRLPTFFVHPPYRNGKGYTYWVQEAEVPDSGQLQFAIGMGELSPERSDGVSFQVYAADASGASTGRYVQIFEKMTNQHQWFPQVVSLANFAGKRVRLKFVADCGPNDNSTTDHAHWGDVCIVRSGTTEEDVTKAVKAMTWVNDRPFHSSFYFHDVRSDEVDVSVVVEGKDNVLLRSLTAHAYPDVMYRVFEGGLVLANPSRKPYTFDLRQLTPGRSYRRIQAVRTQDRQTNNGRPEDGRVSLGGRDALFLVRVR